MPAAAELFRVRVQWRRKQAALGVADRVSPDSDWDQRLGGNSRMGRIFQTESYTPAYTGFE